MDLVIHEKKDSSKKRKNTEKVMHIIVIHVCKVCSATFTCKHHEMKSGLCLSPKMVTKVNEILYFCSKWCYNKYFVTINLLEEEPDIHVEIYIRKQTTTKSFSLHTNMVRSTQNIHEYISNEILPLYTNLHDYVTIRDFVTMEIISRNCPKAFFFFHRNVEVIINER